MTELDQWKQKINQHISQLTNNQKKIAEYMAENFEDIAFKTAEEIGNDIGVSESSILRLVRLFGYEGYKDLKTSVKKSLLDKSTIEHVKNSLDSLNGDSTLRHVHDLSISNLKSSFQHIKEESFQKAVDMILEARNVYIFGMRSSFSAAHYFTLALKHLLGKGKQLGLYPGCVFEEALEIEQNDLLVVFTHKRYYKDVINIARDLKEKNIKIVAITDSVISPIVPYADISFPLKTDTWHYISSAVPYFAVIDAFLAALIQSEHTDVLARLENLETFYQRYQVFHGKNMDYS